MLFDRWRQRILPWGHIGATWRIRLNLCILRPTRVHKTTTQTAPRSVQPCLHRWLRSVSILYNGLPVSPSKLPLPMLVSGPHVICGSLGPPESWTQMATWSFQPFLQGSLVWHTDRATDRPRYLVRCDVIMRSYVGYGKATRSFYVITNNSATIKSLSVHLKHLIKYLV